MNEGNDTNLSFAFGALQGIDFIDAFYARGPNALTELLPIVDRKLNTILFRAAWGALSQVLSIDDRELAAIFTVQTAGDALNCHPHLHGLLADGYWKDGVFTQAPSPRSLTEKHCPST